MASEYKQPSPTPGLIHMGGMVQTPGVSGGSQSGSDFDFGSPQSLSIDTMMQAGDIGGASLTTYRSAPSAMPHGYAGAYEQNLLPQAARSGGSLRHSGSMSSLPEGQSPLHGHQHRLSINSTGPYVDHLRYGSMTGSDATSPELGSNPFAHDSNESITSNPQVDEADRRPSDGQAHPPPAWSELKTKAGKERKRLPLACIACRRKKIRCSGEKPACKHCLRSRIPCVYKVTTRKAAPRTDYMAMLDKRLKRMEERVIKVIPKEEQGIIASTGRAVVKPPLPPAPPKTGSFSKKRAAEAAFDEELDEWAEAKPTAVESPRELANDPQKEPLKVQDGDEYNLLHEGADKLPSKELQEHLSEVFFDFVYGQSYPLLHKPSFMRRLAQGQVPPVLMLAVCAISARFSNHPEVRTQPAFLRGEAWASVAREIALRRYDTPNITILIVYLILGLHEFGTCQGGRSWMFGGMAQRMAYALQLHKDLDHDPRSRGSEEKSELTFTDREIRRRTMWSCFLMDRFNSSGTERPIFVGEQYIRAQLPIKESYYQMEITAPTEDLDGNVPNPVDPGEGQIADARENMGVSAYLIRLVAIWGKLINYMNLGGKDLDQHTMWSEESKFHLLKLATRAWKESLPDSLVYSPENVQNHASEKTANQFIFLHIVYNQIILFMNRFALPTPGSRTKYPKDVPSTFASDASKAAHDAANQISALINEAMDHQVVAPFAGYCAFYSSTVHIYGAFSNNSALEASSKQNLAYNLKYLTKMKKYWGMFHFVTENLKDLYRRHADAARSGNQTGNRDSGDQSIFQYGDWFDRYPHGVSGTDYEEPSADVKQEAGADAVLGQKSDLQTVEEFFSKLVPPSRAVKEQNQPQQQRKMAKRRHTKSESKQITTSQPQQQDHPDSNPRPQAQQSLADETMAAQQNFGNVPGFVPPPTGFPNAFQQPYSMNPSQQYMSQLDRQMVLDSYAGVNAAPNNALPDVGNNPPLDFASQMGMDHFDFNALGQQANVSPDGMWDNSTAWFMPFNLPPPAPGEENSLFSGGFDFSNMGLGLGDVAGGQLPPTGLTPGGDLDLDNGPDGNRVGGEQDGLR